MLDIYQEKILESIIKKCRKSKKEIDKQTIEDLQRCLSDLKDIADNSYQFDKDYTNYNYWIEDQGFSENHLKGFKGVGGNTTVTVKALELITKILDILRGKSLTITIQKYDDKTGEIITYTGKESDLVLFVKDGEVRYDLEASKNKLTKIVESEKIENSYANHYAIFRDIAKDHIRHTEWRTNKKGEKYRSEKLNEGHIVEAFHRHVNMLHRKKKETENYDEPINKIDVIILLYYSHGNTGWWEQGDIGYNQIKNINNQRLASVKSVQIVTQKLISLFENDEFDIKEFNKFFTAHDQEQLTDYRKLSEKKKEELIDKIYKESSQKGGMFKGISKKELRIGLNLKV